MTTAKRTDRIDLRIQPKVKAALQAAALLRHKSVSEFILESALTAADEQLAGRSILALTSSSGQRSKLPWMPRRVRCLG
jgi:uncharacterized protein (DUF1778 family)